MRRITKRMAREIERETDLLELESTSTMKAYVTAVSIEYQLRLPIQQKLHMQLTTNLFAVMKNFAI